MPETKAFELIHADDQFSSLCQELQSSAYLAIDTEFVRESTYYPRFCLLQIATATATFCIDPLAISSLKPLESLMDNPEVCWVLHSARQDLEVLLQCTGRLPAMMLDTQIAAGLAGYHEQVGYAALVENLTGTQLSKEQTRTDWSQRPLSSAQLHYAADDVIYLNQITGILRDQLDQLDRTEWWHEDSHALLSPSLHAPPLQDAWKKVRGLLDLPPQAIARALTIAQWREEAAQRLDIPRSWVLRDETLTHWAEKGDIAAEAVRMRNTPRPLQHELLDDLHTRLAADGPIEFALQLSQSSQGKTDPARKSLIKRLHEATQRCANDLGFSPSVLSTRKDLETLIDHPDRCRLLKGWRKDVIGNLLQETAQIG